MVELGAGTGGGRGGGAAGEGRGGGAPDGTGGAWGGARGGGPGWGGAAGRTGPRPAPSENRPWDAAARALRSPPRHSSVFPVPIRAAVHADSYGMAKTVQEERTDGSLGVQSWNIADNIAELDTFLRETAPEAVGTVREAHPEVCFCALDGGSPAQYSKTGQPAAAFWERIDVLETADEAVLDHVRRGGAGLDAAGGNDDIVDACVLALTARPGAGSLETLPAEPPVDAEGLPMEMVLRRSG